MRERACKNCGGKSYEVVGQNMVKCQFCGTLYVDEHASKEEEVLLVGAYELAREQKFDEAVAEFDKILTLYPLSFESFYGRCLARHKIVFYNTRNLKKPRFFGDEIPSILQDEDFLLAIKHAPGEIVKTYEEQAKRIESLHEEFLKERKNVDVVIVDPKFDPDDDRISKAVESLKECGKIVYFPSNNKTKENEVDTFAALSSCKTFVLIAKDKKSFTNSEIKHFYDRYLYFISQRKKVKTSFIIAIDQTNTTLKNLPKEMEFCKSVLDINSISFASELVTKIKEEEEKTIDELAKIDTVNIGKATPQKKEYVDVETIQPADLGHYHVENAKLTEESKIKWLYLSLKNGDLASAQEVIDDELAKNGNSSEILFAQMMLKRKIRTQEEFFSSISNFQDKDEIEALLKVSGKEFAQYFVDNLENLIIKLDNEEIYDKYLLYLAGFNTPNRDNFVALAERKAIDTLNDDLIEKVLKCFNAEDVDRYINFYFMLAQKSDNKTYYEKILKLDEGHEQSNMALFLSHFRTPLDILTYHNREEVENIFKLLSEEARVRFVSSVVKMILPVAFIDMDKAQAQLDFYLAYVSDQTCLVEILRDIAIKFQRMKFFKVAEKYISIAISKEPDRAEFYWFLISIKAHCVSDSEMIMSINKITQFPEWETLLSVANEMETEKYAALASKINLYEGQKLPFQEDLLDKKSLKDKLQAFLARNQKILSEVSNKEFEQGVRYYSLQLEPFNNYLTALENIDDFQAFEELSSKVRERLELLDLNLSASINVTHLMRLSEGMSVVQQISTPKESLSSKEDNSHLKFWKNFLVGFLGFVPLLFTTLLLVVTMILPKEVYTYFSQDFLIGSVIYSLMFGMTFFVIYAIKKKTLRKKWKIVSLCLFAVGCINVVLLAFGLYFFPQTIKISNAREFDTLLHNASASNFVLEEDIDLADVEWTRVNFTGNLDGQNHTLKNLSFKQSSAVALFNRLSGKICNLQIKLQEKTYDVSNFGVIASKNYGSISNCTVTAHVTIKASANTIVGGLVGNNFGSIENCQATLDITLEAGDKLTFGGLAASTESGKQKAIIKKNQSNLTLNLTLSNCAECIFGGLIGAAGDSTLSQNEAHLEVAASGICDTAIFGGLTGIQLCAGENNYSTGSINLSGLQTSGFVGGLSGQYKNSNREVTISHSYSTVAIFSNETVKAGSLVGDLQGRIDSCFSNQTVDLYGSKTTYADLVNTEKLSSVTYDAKFGFSDDVWNLSSTEYPTLK